MPVLRKTKRAEWRQRRRDAQTALASLLKLGSNVPAIAEALDVAPSSVKRWRNGTVPHGPAFRRLMAWAALVQRAQRPAEILNHLTRE